VGCLGYTIAGGALEFIGLLIVAIEIGRIQRREFGTPRALARLRDWLRRCFGKGKVRHIQAMDRATTTETAVPLTVQRRQAATIEGRVAWLEQQHKDLVREVDEAKKRLGVQIDQIEQQLAEFRTDLEHERAEREQSRRAFLRGTVTLQSVGTSFFLLGVVMSVLGNAFTC
jgi:hypothetical protein